MLVAASSSGTITKPETTEATRHTRGRPMAAAAPSAARRSSEADAEPAPPPPARRGRGSVAGAAARATAVYATAWLRGSGHLERLGFVTSSSRRASAAADLRRRPRPRRRGQPLRELALQQIDAAGRVSPRRSASSAPATAATADTAPPPPPRPTRRAGAGADEGFTNRRVLQMASSVVRVVQRRAPQSRPRDFARDRCGAGVAAAVRPQPAGAPSYRRERR